MTAQDILKLIETVSPDDTDKLDEIDSRVSHYLMYAKGFVTFDYRDSWLKARIRNDDLKKYTRSRDWLKAIRPKGWMVHDLGQDYVTGMWFASLVNPEFGGKHSTHSGEQYTEELAELHAIIQAIEYERNRK